MSQYDYLLERKQIVKIDPDLVEATKRLRAAKRHLGAATRLMRTVADEEELPDEAYAKAYMAGIAALGGLMVAEGYEINKDAKDGHVITLTFGRLALGMQGEKWVNAVRSMRRKRHNIEYGIQEVDIEPKVAEARIESVRELIDLVEQRITGQVPMEL